MSLLLEALKKAERAKEEAQRRSQGESQNAAAAAPPPELALHLQPAPPAADPAPETRPRLEILGDEPKPASPRRTEPTLAPSEEKQRLQPKAEPRASAQAATQSPDRAAARKVFEAKFREPNPRLPFFITLGALGVFAIGTVVYFCIQLRPPAQLVNLNPKSAPASEAPVAAAAPARPLAPRPRPRPGKR